MTYEQLLTTADQNGLLVKEKKLAKHDGLLKGKRIAIRKDIETQAEKSCVLAEELGHHYTSSGDILDQDNIMKQKQEYRARLYGYNLKIGLTGLIRAYEAGCRNLYEMAEFLDATDLNMACVLLLTIMLFILNRSRLCESLLLNNANNFCCIECCSVVFS